MTPGCHQWIWPHRPQRAARHRRVAAARDIEVVGINDLGPVETNAHLLRFD